jgi:putative transposase
LLRETDIIMPKRSLAGGGGVIFHVLNRGSNRGRIFHDAADYAAFEAVLRDALDRYRSRLLAYCLMPNHWHLVIWPRGSELPAVMHRLCMIHAKRWRVRHETVGNGHVYQGRYRAIPVQSDHHLVTLLRYVERNPLRAGIVTRAEDWRWSSLRGRCGTLQRLPITSAPFTFKDDWREYVNAVTSTEEESSIRQAISLNEPLGDSTWASALGAADTGSRVAESATRLPVSDLTN